MRNKTSFMASVGLLGVLAVGHLVAGQVPLPRECVPETRVDERNLEREPDREAIRQTALGFADAFARKDAKAVASHWTRDGEYRGENDVLLRGRDAIENAYSEFFKQDPESRMEIQIDAIRFPSRDSAIEEGTLRQIQNGAQLPTSSQYVAFHTREDGQWKIALCQEWGAGLDRLHDLDWLLGDWKGSVKDQEVFLTFEGAKDRPYFLGVFARQEAGKIVASGNLIIGDDTQRGQLRSWHFDGNGAHGESLWFREGNIWVQDAIGILADGTPTAAINLLTRLSNDEFSWRSIDRVVGNQSLPDSVPINLRRATREYGAQRNLARPMTEKVIKVRSAP